MIRKAALVGCKEGPWIRVRDEYRNPRLELQGAPGTVFGLWRSDCDVQIVVEGPTVFCLDEVNRAPFVRVAVLSEGAESALCHLLADGGKLVPT